MCAISKKKQLLDNMLKQEITNAVLAMVQSKENITMEEVAKRCGIAKGTLYNYFKSREDMINHVHKNVISPIIETNTRIFKGTDSPEKKIYAFIDTVYGIHDNVCSYFRFMQSIRTVEDEVKERYEVVIKPLAEIIEDGIKMGIFIDNDPYVMADMIFGAVVGPLKTLFYRDMPCTDMERIKKSAIALIDRIIIKQ